MNDDFVFARDEHGRLELRGDFEGLYKADPDPWSQSGHDPNKMQGYYLESRRNLVLALGELPPWRAALEVGCGLGYVTNLLSVVFPDRRVDGVDVSPTAIERARVLFPAVQFRQGDIATLTWDAPEWHAYDVVILSQILWYVMAKMPVVVHSCLTMLRPAGHLVIQTAHLDVQEYGRELMDGFAGLVRYMLREDKLQLVSARYGAGDQFAPYHDGVLVMRKCK
jgi:SAM-dependent methyltransferase